MDQLVEMGVKRDVQLAGLKVGICGEHGGDPASIDFCHRVGLDYVSCSPFRDADRRLAAADGDPQQVSESTKSVAARMARRSSQGLHPIG
ncbi:MAG: putative PEP-binding protein [Pirellulaceae bacterium]